jgi:endoglucanase
MKRTGFKAMLLGLLGAALATVGADRAQAADQAPTFRRGVNVLGYDPFWKAGGEARFKARHFAEIRRAGFDFVRVNLFAFGHLDAADRLDPEWLKKVDWVVREARKAGLGVILDEHDFDACSNDVAMCRDKLRAVWRQLAPRFRNAPSGVAFELLNEPHAKLDAEAWNALMPDILAIVRATNPRRTVIVGPTSWNAYRELPGLRLPEKDRNILVTFHYYDPFRFTHQGASWTDLKELRGVTWGSEADLAQLREDFAKVAQWARANRRPILLGEFGAYDKSGTPQEMRVAYTAAVAREAERQGFAWAYWQFDGDFIVWDMSRDVWVTPIRDALIPQGR